MVRLTLPSLLSMHCVSWCEVYSVLEYYDCLLETLRFVYMSFFKDYSMKASMYEGF